MRTLLVWIASAAAVGCAGAQAQAPDRRGWTERMADANRHDQLAVAHETAARDTYGSLGSAAYTCGDTVLNDQLTTGGYKVTSWTPCWNIEEEAAQHHRYVAERERDAARRDRAGAAELVRAEQTACAGISEQEREHSPFAHQKEIAQVIPHRETGQLTGVWVIFKPVLGLRAEWMQRDIACYRAHWAMTGKDPRTAPYDPTLIEDAVVQVFDRGGHVEVLVTTPSRDTAELVVARAQGAMTPTAQTATR